MHYVLEIEVNENTERNKSASNEEKRSKLKKNERNKESPNESKTNVKILFLK